MAAVIVERKGVGFISALRCVPCAGALSEQFDPNAWQRQAL
jgi:hypothetical protein